MRGSGVTGESAMLVTVVAAPIAIAKPGAAGRISVARGQQPSGVGYRSRERLVGFAAVACVCLRIYGTVVRG
jgi:hypothetical protein